MSERHLISVLIPAWQAEKRLRRCLDSVLAQTYGNLEICLADDGSTDNTVEIARTYTGKSGIPVNIEPLPHQGVSAARQRLVKMARGEYLFFLDADDYIDPRTIEVLLGIAQEYNADLVQCTIERTDKDYIPPIDCGSPGEPGGPDLHIYDSRVRGMTAYLSAAGPLRCMLAGKLYRRTLLDGITFPIGKIHEDEATIHRILNRARVTVCTTLPLYHYFTNPDSITRRKFSTQRFDALDVFREKCQFCWEQGYYTYAKLRSLYYCVTCVKLYQAALEAWGPEDPHLSWLHECFQKSSEYYISTGLAGQEFAERLRRQGEDMTVWTMPYFFDTVRDYFRAEEGGKIRRLLAQWPQISHKEDEIMKKLTIIIPVYNNPDELRLTLGSVAGSRFPLEDVEVIVCDDGSAPGMEAVAMEYASRFSVRYFWQEDKGFRPGQARNMGIRAAKGELCLFLDCGVIVTIDCLAEHWRLYQEHGPKVVTIGYIYGNDLTSDLDEMRQIIDGHSPDEAADIMESRGMRGRPRAGLRRWRGALAMASPLDRAVEPALLRAHGVYAGK